MLVDRFLLIFCIIFAVGSVGAASKFTDSKARSKVKKAWKSQTKGSKRVHAAGEMPDLTTLKPAEFKQAAVAADHELCSKMGREILEKEEATAADALVTTHCCVEIVNSHSTGLGGGGFVLYHKKKGKFGESKSFDFRETLPEFYKDSTNQTQGDTILVPGVLKGLHKVWEKYGKLPWGDLWKPCVNLAKNGFPIHDSLANAIEAKADYIMKNENLKLLFAPDGVIKRKGEILKRPVLAETFRKIGESGGSDIFYKGEIAKTIVKNVKDAGGQMSLDDLADFEVSIRSPLATTVKKLKMLSTPPPGSGSLISLALKIMEQFKWNPEDQYKEQPLLFHNIIEALKFAYAPQTFMGDPKFTKNTEEVAKYMLDDETAKKMFKKIDRSSHTVDYYKPFSSLQDIKTSGTTHISIIDRHGNGCGATTSVNAYFGSKLRSKELGFVYNNELADFSEFWQRVYNLTSDKKVPGKKPMSKASPTIFLDKHGDVVGVFGAAGGFFIPTALIQTIANWLFFRNNIAVAVAKPRIHCQLFPPTVVYEPTFPQDVYKGIEKYSHQYVTNSTYDVSGQLNAIMGVVQAIVRLPDGKINAYCDYRKGGLPAGF